MKNQATKELLDKYLDGTCTTEEKRLVLDWLKSDDNVAFLNAMEKDWSDFDIDKDNSEFEFDPRFEELEDKISTEKVIWFKPWLKIAASLLLVAMFSFIIYTYLNPQQEFITKSTQKGKPSIVTLDDGSKVTLSAGSTISYPVKFASNRQVFLEGEAYFDIRDSELTIYAGNVATKASHSSFNVSAFPDDEEVVVSVMEGKAEVVKEKKTMPLIKLRMPKVIPLTKLIPAVVVNNNEYLAYNKEDSSLNKGADFDPKEVSAWKEGIIYFNNADSAKVIKKLERWYGVNIEVNGCLGQKVFNGEFSNQSLEEILMTITTNPRSKLKYKEEGNQIQIDGNCI